MGLGVGGIVFESSLPRMEEGELGECPEVLRTEPVVMVVVMFGMGCEVVLMIGLGVFMSVLEGEEMVVVEQGLEVALSPSTLRIRLSVTLLSQTCLSTSCAGDEEEDERELTAALLQLGTFV